MKYLLILPVLFLSGCFTANREENTATIKEETRTGVEAGKPTNVHIITREQTETQEKASAGVDIQAAIKAAVSASMGDISSTLAALKPQDLSPFLAKLDNIKQTDLSPVLAKFSALESKAPQGTDWEALAAAAASALIPAAGAGFVLHKKAKEAEARAHAANERSIYYAEKVDPETAGSYHPQDTRKKI